MFGFKIEDGSGYSDSNSYIDTDTANTYHALFGNADWSSLTADQMQAYLVQATASIDYLYGQEFYSLPQSHGTSIQALLFPRFTMVVNGIQIIQAGQIPLQLKKAVAEVALMASQGIDIMPQPNTMPFVGQQTVRVGGLETSTSYRTKVKAEKFPGFWKVEKILFPLLKQTHNPILMSL